MKKLIALALLILASSITNLKVLLLFTAITLLAIYQIFKRNIKQYIKYFKDSLINFLFE